MTEPQFDVPVYADSIEAFSYQVAGHGALLKIGNKICKPVIPIELSFYKSVQQHPNLLPFTATFYGTVELILKQNELQSIMTEIDDRSNCENSSSTERGGEVLNPWSAKVIKSQFINYISLDKSVHKYMVLEDLTRPFKHPCICDIKMGTRQHGDDAPADKRFRHQNKVLTTTSLPLGVRMCGIQNFQVNTKSYIYSSKYDGRKLKKDTIKPAISSFFNNGVEFRLDVLVQIVERLKEFYGVMESLVDKFRFYSTSLLMVYEGDPDAPSKIDVKMIDFAHTFAMTENDVNDDGYLFGLRNLIDLMEQIVADHKDQGNSKL